MNQFPKRHHSGSINNSHRRGQALVEFGIISFVLAGIVAGLLTILVLALGSFQNNIASENAGRELDGHRLLIEQNFREHFADPMDSDYFDPDADDFEDVTARQVYRFLNEYEIDGNGTDDDGPVLYDEALLILSPANYRDKIDPRTNSEMPEINESLLGQYIFDPDVVPEGSSEQGAYRYPGAVVRNTRTNRQTVLIPLLPEGTGAGTERSFNVDPDNLADFYPVSEDWVAPVVIGKPQDGDGFEFQVIMFYPSQPASSINIDRVEDAEGRLVSQIPVEANDQAIVDAVDSILALPGDYEFATPAVNPNFGASPSRGQFGLGESFAFATTVRPYRLVFETRSLFRMGASLNPILIKYEAEDAAIALNNNVLDDEDQFLDFDSQVIDRSVPSLRRYIIDEMASSDFDTNQIQLQANDDGNWRVSASAEVQSTVGGDWDSAHELEIRLYRNGLYVALIDRHVVNTSTLAAASQPIVLKGDAVTQAVEDDLLQVRIFTRYPGAAYDVELTGAPQTNWVTFERIGD